MAPGRPATTARFLARLELLLSETELAEFNQLFASGNYAETNPPYQAWLGLKRATLPAAETQAAEQVCIALSCTTLHYTTLHYLHYTTLHYTTLHYTRSACRSGKLSAHQVPGYYSPYAATPRRPSAKTALTAH